MYKRNAPLKASFAVLGVAALIAAGCGDDDSNKSENSSKSDTTTMSTMEHDSSTKTGFTTSPAADTRVTLDRLLGEHAILATLATTRALQGGKDASQAAAALTANGEELADVIGSVYGDDARDTFDKQWKEHVGYLVDYTKATATKDAAAKQKAVDNLDAYVESFGEFLATATGLPPQAVKDGLKAHVQMHAGIIDAYAKKDYASANTQSRAAYEHMIMLGDTLAGAIATQQKLDEGDATDAGVDTRVTLGKLLGEHTAIAYQATTDALASSPNFDESAKSLTANSKDLAEVIGSVYGDDAKASFDKQWTEHIGYLVEYTTAEAKGDDAAKQAAVKKLDGYVESFGGFLATATGLPPQAVKDALDAHVKHHAGSIDAFKAGDFDQAYELDRTANEHMWKIGDTLAEAIVKQQSEKSSS